MMGNGNNLRNIDADRDLGIAGSKLATNSDTVWVDVSVGMMEEACVILFLSMNLDILIVERLNVKDRFQIIERF